MVKQEDAEHELDYESVLKITRAVREQIDWDDVRERKKESPFARAFLTLAEGLELVEPPRRSANYLKSASSELKTPAFGGLWVGARVIWSG